MVDASWKEPRRLQEGVFLCVNARLHEPVACMVVYDDANSFDESVRVDQHLHAASCFPKP